MTTKVTVEAVTSDVVIETVYYSGEQPVIDIQSTVVPKGETTTMFAREGAYLRIVEAAGITAPCPYQGASH